MSDVEQITHASQLWKLMTEDQRRVIRYSLLDGAITKKHPAFAGLDNYRMHDHVDFPD